MSKLIGTSGYDYKWWEQIDIHQTFFPQKCKRKLEFYAEHFNFLELNCTFYRLPSEKSVNEWYMKTPHNFKFLAKFSQYMTHFKKFHDFEQGWNNFMTPVRHLREKLHGVLFQFPDTFHYTHERMILFYNAEKFMRGNRPLIYLELRHESWFIPEVIEQLKPLDWILVITSNPSGFQPSELVITKPDHVMFRMHGPIPGYRGSYSDEQLVIIASYINNIKNAVVSFNNTDSLEGQSIMNDKIMLLSRDMVVNTPHAIKNAKTLISLLT